MIPRSNVSILSTVIICTIFYGGLESVGIGKCRNRKVSESESVRIGKCQNWKVSESESVRIGKCQNYLEFKDSLWMSQILFKKQFRFMTCAKRSLVYHGLIHKHTYIWFAPYLKNLKMLTLSNSDTSNSDTFRFWHFPILKKNAFWHFPILQIQSSMPCKSVKIVLFSQKSVSKRAWGRKKKLVMGSPLIWRNLSKENHATYVGKLSFPMTSATPFSIFHTVIYMDSATEPDRTFQGLRTQKSSMTEFVAVKLWIGPSGVKALGFSQDGVIQLKTGQAHEAWLQRSSLPGPQLKKWLLLFCYDLPFLL